MNFNEQSFFFTPLERDRIAQLPFASSVRPSFVNVAFAPLWSCLSSCIPETVAPNSITLLGTLCTVQAYYIIAQYFSTQPEAATIVSALLLFVSFASGSLDGEQARRYRSGSPLGDIFSKICGSTNRIFQALTLFCVIGLDANDPTHSWMKWYVLLSLQLLEFILILGRIALADKDKGIGRLLGNLTYAVRESEISLLLILVMLLRLCAPAATDAIRTQILAHSGTAYSTMVVASMSSLFLVNAKSLPRTRKLLILACLSLRALPMVFLLPLSATNDLTLISDAVVVSLLSIEVYVSHFAERRIHAAVALICFLSLVNALATIMFVLLYLVGLLADISYSTRIPLFVPVRNVFIDGVYDLCHIGHKRVMEHALQFGNRLVVGVLSDEDCIGYKRRPVMTTEERCREVASCRFVSEVVAGSPVDGLTEEFLRKHNIHVVVCGEEYDKPDDHYYAVPRRMGILKTAPRTQGMSTSVLIKRIQEANAEELVAKDKLRGESAVKDGS